MQLKVRLDKNDKLYNERRPGRQARADLASDASSENISSSKYMDTKVCTPPLQFSLSKTTPMPKFSSSELPFVSTEHIRSPVQTYAAPKVEIIRQLHELPIFAGKVEEWPTFAALFNETTVAYRYSNLENLIRLQKSLTGQARQIVEAILVFPDNMPSIMEELEFRFGRTDLLVKSQILKLRNIPIIAEDDFTQLIAFSTSVRNFVTFLKSANEEYQLRNPLLLEELVAKLPMPRQLEWAYKWSIIGNDATIIMFAEWLRYIAKVCSRLETFGTSAAGSADDKIPKPMAKKYTLISTAKNQPRSSSLRCFYCSSNHYINNCPEFLKLSIQDKWVWVKEKHRCFSCLNSGHRVGDCRRKNKCTVDGCQLSHHILLHENEAIESHMTKNAKDTSTNTFGKEHQPEDEVHMKIVAFTVYGSGSKKINTYAVIDEASSVTLMDASLAKELNLQPVGMEATELTWLNGTTTKSNTPIVHCNIKGRNASCDVLQLKTVRLMDDLSLPCQSMNANELIEYNPELNGLSLRSFSKVTPRILIGLNNVGLGYSIQSIVCKPAGPIVMKTPLGWIVYGPMNYQITKKKGQSCFICG